VESELSTATATPDARAAELYARYLPQIHSYCLSRLRSREEAEDAAQNVFLRVCTALRKGVVPELEAPWLYKIAHNVCVSRALGSKRRARVEGPTDVEALDVAAPAVGRPDELLGLGDALADMPENLRRVILLREWQGLSYAEIAQTTGQTHAAVETLIFRARRHLAKALAAVNLGTPFWVARRWLWASAAPAKVAAGTVVVGLAGSGLVLGLAVDPPRSHSISRSPAPLVVSVHALPIVARATVAAPVLRKSSPRRAAPARIAAPAAFHVQRAAAPAPKPSRPTSTALATRRSAPHEPTLAPAAPVVTPAAPEPEAPAAETSVARAETTTQSQPDLEAATVTVAIPEPLPVDVPPVEVPAAEVPAVPELPAVPTVTVRVPKLPPVPTLP
jgi:RNA polymerase sigma-70 factor (ECF subfamily)